MKAKICTMHKVSRFQFSLAQFNTRSVTFQVSEKKYTIIFNCELQVWKQILFKTSWFPESGHIHLMVSSDITRREVLRFQEITSS